MRGHAPIVARRPAHRGGRAGLRSLECSIGRTFTLVKYPPRNLHSQAAKPSSPIVYNVHQHAVGLRRFNQNANLGQYFRQERRDLSDLSPTSRPPITSFTESEGASGDGHDERWLGLRLKALRRERKLSLHGLAELSGLSTGMLSQIERGLSSPSIRSLRLLGVALRVPISWFFALPEHEGDAGVPLHHPPRPAAAPQAQPDRRDEGTAQPRTRRR